MHIAHLEIANFRKLLSVRIDLADQTTLFVGANNSGKTSAMLALRRFLTKRGKTFEKHDLTLCHWAGINALGQAWINTEGTAPPDLQLDSWVPFLPVLDIWLNIAPNELHFVSKLVPKLDWTGGKLGVRLRLEPKDIPALHKEFTDAFANTQKIKAAMPAAAGESGAAPAPAPKLTLWPSSLMDFLERRLNAHFEIRAYTLDPDKLVEPTDAIAQPQKLIDGVEPIDGDPLAGLIRINEISAQRGFGEVHRGEDDEGVSTPGGLKLSDQVRDYYKRHLDPSEYPDPTDIGALQAVEEAQDAFDLKLTESFKEAFTEVETMGYPGITDPKPHVSTRLKPVDGLNHQAAISFQVDVVKGDGGIVPVLRLPEGNNGLGYQNLISMIFRLMSFRAAWMRVGKASKGPDAGQLEPLHLVLVEEPEAHLHAQVQQVFIKKAYEVLRAHEDLGENSALCTQLVVSTHSSHVAHETPYSCLRYFRRLPAGMNKVQIPTSVVINLTNAFGEESETKRFVTRYLRAQHADVFFADALILVEGSAERMFLPNFIARDYARVNQGYVSMLEVGGSHAHRLKPLINLLGITTLIITDLDAQSGEAVQPKVGENQVTNNDTLKSWWPQKTKIDELLDPDVNKVLKQTALHEVRVAYQTPIEVVWPEGTSTQTAIPYTFEDALAFTNMKFFSELDGIGLVAKFREAIANSANVGETGTKFFQALRKGVKAEFALNVLGAEGFEKLAVPSYIADGLAWLNGQLEKKQIEVLSTDLGSDK
ncbi:AAA family ATPase [Mesorhizobium sp.]|uniref:AAA family ATPase n=1 Tax=Mesorhizobium sp. TaxID=1871066 RepID=UPI000FE583BE|nr:AAA family ATPase [Mesorhizobium sp.]RWD69071.1 MAG: ATP-dependent endonuclease [Mesorhizobium sp.]